MYCMHLLPRYWKVRHSSRVSNNDQGIRQFSSALPRARAMVADFRRLDIHILYTPFNEMR